MTDPEPDQGAIMKRGHASETGVNDRPDVDATPGAVPRPRPSRADVNTSTGRALLHLVCPYCHAIDEIVAAADGTYCVACGERISKAVS